MTDKANDIRLSGLSIGYSGRRGAKIVARGLTATVRGGELTCLVGPNGAGKSTLLRTIAGAQPPLEGSVSLCGRPLADYTPRLLARTVAIVLTEKPDVANMTVAEMVALGRSPYTGFWGTCSAGDRREAARAMATVGIGGLAGRRVATLSDGERQKTMIAKALAQQTPVVVLDEPTAFLDFPSKAEVMRLLHRVSHETGRAVFLSTHDLDLALQTADTLWLLDSSGTLAVGTPEDLALDGRLGAFFAGEGVEFDGATGLFSVSHSPTRSVGVAGADGLRRRMLCKALLRSGIAAAPPQPGADIVEVTDTAFVVTAGGRTTSATTVAGALRALAGV